MLPRTVKNSNYRRVGRKKGRRFGQTYLRQKTHGRSSRAKSVILSGPKVNIICKHKQGAIENRPKMPTRRNKSWLSAFECFRYVLSNRVTGWWSFWAVSGAHAGAERTFRHTLPVEKDAESRLAWHNTQIHQAKAKLGSLCVDNTTRTKTPVLRLRRSFVSCSGGVAVHLCFGATLSKSAANFAKFCRGFVSNFAIFL